MPPQFTQRKDKDIYAMEKDSSRPTGKKRWREEEPSSGEETHNKRSRVDGRNESSEEDSAEESPEGSILMTSKTERYTTPTTAGTRTRGEAKRHLLIGRLGSQSRHRTKIQGKRNALGKSQSQSLQFEWKDLHQGQTVKRETTLKRI